jgi:hypothetical protein
MEGGEVAIIVALAYWGMDYGALFRWEKGCLFIFRLLYMYQWSLSWDKLCKKNIKELDEIKNKHWYKSTE